MSCEVAAFPFQTHANYGKFVNRLCNLCPCLLFLFFQVSAMDEYIQPIMEHCGKYKMEYPALPLFILGNHQKERDYHSTNLSILKTVIETCFKMIKSSEHEKL